MRLIATIAIAGILALTRAQGAWAQNADFAERGPRFLTKSNAGAVKVDVAKTPVLRKRISLDLQNVNIYEAIAAISRQGGLEILYRRDLWPTSRTVSLEAKNITVAAALWEVLLDTGVDVLFSSAGIAALIQRTGQAWPVGQISGRVTDSATKEVVSGAVVTVDGARISAMTSAEGRYVLKEVPIGERTLSIRRLGYSRRSRTVSVTENAAFTVDFVMARTPTQLTEIVVTPTGDRQRLEVGNAIGTIKADSVVTTTLIRNMSDLLQARVSGVVVTNTSGLVGAPSKVRIRGVNSIALNNDPILIVDGVRVLSSTTVAANQPNVGSPYLLSTPTRPLNVTERAPSRLDDIDPSMIESIDVLRGPSASSLYGTDAANGVIVIKTKKGKAGPWRVSLTGDHQTSRPIGKYAEEWFGWGSSSNQAPTPTCTLAIGVEPTSVLGGTCAQDSVTHFNLQNHPDLQTIGTGRSQTFNASLSGGTDRWQQHYSLSGGDNIGMAKMSELQRRVINQLWTTEPPSWMRRPNRETSVNGSSRTTFLPASHTDVSVTISGHYLNVLNGGTGVTIRPVMLGLGDSLAFLPSELQRTKLSSDVRRGTLALTTNNRLLGWLNVAASAGGDYAQRTDGADLRREDCTTFLQGTQACPSGHILRPDHLLAVNINVGANASFKPISWLDLRTSVGEQYTKTRFHSLQVGNSSGCALSFGTTILSAVPECTNASAQRYAVNEASSGSATAGWYVEQSIGVFGMYSSVGVRHDVGSAFGSRTNQSGLKYPKLNISYPISERPWFPRNPYVSSVRLRAAYGHSGNQASETGVLNAFTFQRITYTGGIWPMLKLDQIGNPDLKPERTTEWERGIDITFGEREFLTAEVTAYRKFTRDAITNVTLPPSASDMALLSMNLGNVENKGVELSATARLVDSPMAAWSIVVNYARNRNKLVKKAASLAENGPGNTNTFFREGYPVFGYWARPVKSYADANNDGMLARNEIVIGPSEFVGAPYPASEASYVNNVAIAGGALHFSASMSHIKGQVTRLTVGGNSFQTRGAVDRTASLGEQAAWVQAWANNGYLLRSSTLRLNEVSMTYNVPLKHVLRFVHAKTASVTIAGRNLALWSDYVGTDSNVDTFRQSQGNIGEVAQDDGTGVAQPRMVAFRFAVGF